MRDLLHFTADRKGTDLLLKKQGFWQTGLNSEHCEYSVLVKREKQVIFSHKTQRGCQHDILDIEICSFLKKYQQRASKLIHRYAEGPLRCWPGSRTTLN